MIRHFTRWRLALLVLASLIVAVVPQTVAACGIHDVGACVDDAQYTLWRGLAALGWSLNRTLLVLAYQVDSFRWWVMEVAFTSLYQMVVRVVDPLMLPIATVAVILAALSLLLVPLFGRPLGLDLRHTLTWVVLAPVLLTLSGPMVIELERLRSGVADALTRETSQLAPGAIFGSQSDDLAEVVALYPTSVCPTALARGSNAISGTLALDDIAAALLWADAADLHCPALRGPFTDLPDRFAESAPDGPGYAQTQAVGTMLSAALRTTAVDLMQQGAIRTALALIPALLAVAGATLQLLFALCFVLLWMSLPLGMLVVWFHRTADPITGIVRRTIRVLQVAWTSSFQPLFTRSTSLLQDQRNQHALRFKQLTLLFEYRRVLNL